MEQHPLAVGAPVSRYEYITVFRIKQDAQAVFVFASMGIGGENVQYTATVIPDNATHPEVTWDSSDKEVATIDQSGNVTIVGAGTTTITATAGGIIAEHTLVVLTREAVVKVTYANGTVTNSGTNSAIEVDTVVRHAIENPPANTPKTDAFNHTDSNTFVTGIDGDANGALKTNNENGSYLLIKGYNLGTNDFTISTWVYIDDYKKLSKDNGKSQIFGMSNPDNNPIKGITLSIKRNNKDAAKATAGQLLYKTPSITGNQVISTNLNCNGWHKYTVTREGTSVKIYFDSTLLATTPIAENADLGANDICENNISFPLARREGTAVLFRRCVRYFPPLCTEY